LQRAIPKLPQRESVTKNFDIYNQENNMESMDKVRSKMEYKELTPGTKIPVIGIGTWTMGGGLEGTDVTYDKENICAIKTAIKLGMTHVDTAEMYGCGHSEELVGEAISDFNRETLFITTKVSPTNLRYDDLINSAKQSLKRLRTEYINLYLVHMPNPEIPIQETMGAMDFLCERGLVKHIGVSNFSVEQIKEAQKYAQNEIVANQIEYNLLIRNSGGLYNANIESEIIPYCQANAILVVAYRPLAKGELVKRSFKTLDELAKKYNKTQAQIAMNWLISKKGIITIPKTSNIKHLKENLGAIGWRLKSKDIYKLDNQFEGSSL